MSKNKIKDNEYPVVISLYNNGLSKSKIEHLYGVSNSVIDRIFKENNVVVRDNSHKLRHYTLDENYFDKIDTKNKAYILGLLYADGCNYTKLNQIKLVLQESDKDILEKINNELNYSRPLTIRNLSKKNKNWQDAFQLYITNKHMSETLNSYGMIPRKSLTLVFPSCIEKSLTLDFIRGYFDGDGNISVRSVSLVSTLNFCTSIKLFLYENYNIKSSIGNISNKNNSTRILRICGIDNTTRFLDLIYKNSDLHIQRKYNSYLNFKKKYNK